MEVSLNHLLPGQKGCIVSSRACDRLYACLDRIGAVPGAWVRCVGKSRNGQVTFIQVGGNCVRLQTRELEKIRVRV